MKTKKVRPILVKNESPTNLKLIKSKHLLLGEFKANWLKEDEKYQQLILISLDPDEKIEDGDVYYHDLVNTTSTLVKEGLVTDDVIKTLNKNKHNHKVIATQSQIPESYIQQFIKDYNEGKVEDVEIEMELFWNNGGKYGIQPFPNETVTEKDRVYLPKLTNGFVTIVEKEGYTLTDWLNLSKEDLEVILPKGITKKSVLYTDRDVGILMYKSVIYGIGLSEPHTESAAKAQDKRISKWIETQLKIKANGISSKEAK